VESLALDLAAGSPLSLSGVVNKAVFLWGKECPGLSSLFFVDSMGFLKS
jgi:hypothetical protein